jgi:hypothetical protein
VYRARGERDAAVRELRKAMEVLADAQPACVWAQRTRAALAEVQ